MIAVSKERSFLLKGIVIIMMIFLHLFNGNSTAVCVNLLYIGDEPLAKWLSHACGPVAFFVLFSGYGMAYTYENKSITFFAQLKRIFKLYLHYWVVLAVFLPLACYLYPERFPWSYERFLYNVSGWKTDYNYEMWFLLPYSLVALTSGYLIKSIKKIGFLASVIITAVINFVACYVISKYHATVLTDYPLINWSVVYLQFLYPFTMGVTFYSIKLEMKRELPTWLIILLIMVSVAVVATLKISVTYIIYVPLMVFLLNQLQYPHLMERLLIELGRKSMPMWMIHTWYCNYLFKEQVYSLKYPIFILGG